MSYKKGYIYSNIIEFVDRYNCKLITTEENIKLKPKSFIIKGRCGHDSEVTFDKLLNKKRGIYCDDCIESIEKMENLFFRSHFLTY